jgi:hypothetical protein
MDKGGIKIDTGLWTQQKILQFLAGNSYNNEKCYEAMQTHEKFRE